jgi:hypothetical protein
MARRRSSRILPGPESGSGSESVSLPPLLGRGGSAGSRTSCSALRGLGGTPPPGCEGEGGRGESRGGGEGNWEERGRGRGMCVGSGVAAGGVDWLWGHLMTLLCCGWGTRFCCVSFFFGGFIADRESGRSRWVRCTFKFELVARRREEDSRRGLAAADRQPPRRGAHMWSRKFTLPSWVWLGDKATRISVSCIHVYRF